MWALALSWWRIQLLGISCGTLRPFSPTSDGFLLAPCCLLFVISTGALRSVRLRRSRGSPPRQCATRVLALVTNFQHHTLDAMCPRCHLPICSTSRRTVSQRDALPFAGLLAMTILTYKASVFHHCEDFNGSIWSRDCYSSNLTPPTTFCDSCLDARCVPKKILITFGTLFVYTWCFKKFIQNLNQYNVTDYLQWGRGIVLECNFSTVGALKCDVHLILSTTLANRSTSISPFAKSVDDRVLVNILNRSISLKLIFNSSDCKLYKGICCLS